MIEIISIFYIIAINVTTVYAQQNKQEYWSGSTHSKAYKAFDSLYLQSKEPIQKTKPKIRFDSKRSSYEIYNEVSKKWIYLISKEPIYKRKLSSEQLTNLITMSSQCPETQVQISFHDSSPELASVYLGPDKIGDDIKNGRYSYTTMGICRGTNLIIEISKHNYQTSSISYIVPKEGGAAIDQTVHLKHL